MSLEENKEVVRGFIEAASNVKGDVSKIQPMVDKYLSLKHIHHTPNGDTTLEQTMQFYEMILTALPI